MSIPNNLGHKYDSSLPVININTGNANTSTSGQITSTILNSVFGVGLLALTGAMKGGSSAGTQETQQVQQTQQTPEQEYQTNLQKLDLDIASVNGQIEYLQSQCTSQEQIDALDKEIKSLEGEVNKDITTQDGKSITKEDVQKYVTANKDYSEAKASFDIATQNYDKAVADLEALRSDRNSIDSSGATEEEKTTAKQTLDKQIKDAQAKKEQAKIEKDKQLALLNKAVETLEQCKVSVNKDTNEITGKQDWQKNIDATLDKIKEKKVELQKMKNTMKGNQDSIAVLQKQLTALQTKRAGAVAAHDKLVTDGVVAKSKMVKMDSTNADNYQKGVKGNGNWWKRNMPTWLGGSNKVKTAQYKEQNEKKNDAIESYMKAHNCTRSQAKKALKQLAQLNNNSTSGTKSNQSSTVLASEEKAKTPMNITIGGKDYTITQEMIENAIKLPFKKK